MDPSITNFGYALAEVDTTSGAIEILQLSLQKTEPNTQKTVRKNSEDLERCRQQVSHMRTMAKYAHMVCVEIPVGSQSARAMASYGFCIGILASLDIPMIQVTPNQVKRAAVGTKTASKAEMIKWAMAKYPHKDWHLKKGKPLGCNEHMADAIAAIEAGIATSDYANAIAMRQHA